MCTLKPFQPTNRLSERKPAGSTSLLVLSCNWSGVWSCAARFASQQISAKPHLRIKDVLEAGGVLPVHVFRELRHNQSGLQVAGHSHRVADLLALLVDSSFARHLQVTVWALGRHGRHRSLGHATLNPQRRERLNEAARKISIARRLKTRTLHELLWILGW